MNKQINLKLLPKEIMKIKKKLKKLKRENKLKILFA